MKCEQINNIILTDYMNQECSDEQRKMVEEHLAQCPNCREYYSHLQDAVIVPLDGARRYDVPSDIWKNISDTICEEEEPPRESFIDICKQRLNALVVMPKPAFALSSAAVVVLVAIGILWGPLGRGSRQQLSASDKTEILLFLTDEYSTFLSDGVTDADLEFEDYFL